MRQRLQFRRTSLWLVFCIALIVGIAVATKLSVPFGLKALPLLIGLPLLRRRGAGALIMTLVLGLVLGLGRGSVYMQKRAQYEPLYYQPVSLTVTVLNDGVYGKTKQLTFDASDIRLQNGQRLVGKIQMSGFGLNAIFEGDEIRATGKLYPIRGASQGRMSFAKLTLVAHHPSLVGDIRRSFNAGMQNALPEPLNAFAMGLIVGQRATLPTDIKDALLMVGLTHIIAVSGYNLTIMLRASKGLFASRSKRIATGLSLLLIGVFLLLAGSSASIVRAAIVSVLSIWAGYYGRDFRPLLLILLAAAITAYANPLYIWSDAGWYLSFLAFGGVMILAPLIAVRLPRRVQRSLVAMVALESFCAEAATLPYLLHTFGQMSFIGLIANVLVVALVPLAMLLSVVAGLVGMLAPALAGWVAWPAGLLLTYMLDTAQLLSKIPHVFQKNLMFSTAGTVGLYMILCLLCWLLHFKNSRKRGILTDKNHNQLALLERMRVL